MTKYAMNTLRIYEIVLNLVQRYVDKVRKPTYRLMQHCGPCDHKVYKGEGWQLMWMIIGSLPYDRDKHTLLERMTASMDRSDYITRRKYKEHIDILIEKSLVHPVHPRRSVYIVNPEYIPMLDHNDMVTINTYILPQARDSIMSQKIPAQA